MGTLAKAFTENQIGSEASQRSGFKSRHPHLYFHKVRIHRPEDDVHPHFFFSRKNRQHFPAGKCTPQIFLFKNLRIRCTMCNEHPHFSFQEKLAAFSERKSTPHVFLTTFPGCAGQARASLQGAARCPLPARKSCAQQLPCTSPPWFFRGGKARGQTLFSHKCPSPARAA